MDDVPKRRILIIRFSSIGDIVLTTPVIRAVKTQIPNVELHVLTKDRNAIILQNNRCVDKLHTIKSSTSEITKELRQLKFDAVIDLQKNIRSRFLCLKLLKCPHSFPKLNFRKWLLTTFNLNLMPDKHLVDRYFQAVRKLNVHNDGLGLDYRLIDEDFESLSLLPHNFEAGFVAIACGSQHATKQLPTAKVIEICKQLSLPVVLLGDRDDRKKAIEIENAVGAKVFNACSALNLNQTAAIIEKAKLVITGDTSLLHIAAALRKNIIVIWGNTTPAFGFGAYEPQNSTAIVHNFQVIGLKCRPCSKIGRNECPKHHFKCMENQDANLISATANKILSQ
ncbi:MAG: glycosyltransferase family 9 protein [Bacteroidales bacterium]|jgi:ADP-heptose:LPS heptosyltransferase|nr:glycosyltransferase family 9 protein [Bacteroidales bacterium]